MALKVYINSSKVHRELPIYKHINEMQLEHRGRWAVRKFFESFEIEGPHGRHICLVLQPLGPSLDELRDLMVPDRLYRVDILRQGVRQILAGLQFLHKVNVIHTGKSKQSNAVRSHLLTRDKIFSQAIYLQALTMLLSSPSLSNMRPNIQFREKR